MDLFNGFFWSDFRRIFAKNKDLFKLSGYHRAYYFDGGNIEDAFYFDSRNKKLIRFSENVRESTIERLMLCDCKSIFEAEFKEIKNNDANLDTETLKEELAVAETDAEELNAYLKFLKENHIIGEPD